jgi:dihydrodipicolinate synthase/N-acetylneuraminate lyase
MMTLPSKVTEALVRFGFDFRIFVGMEELSFPMMALGACGMVMRSAILHHARWPRSTMQ